MIINHIVYTILGEMKHNIQYRIVGFDLTQFAPSWDSMTKGDRFNLNSGMDFSYNHANRVIRCQQDIEFTHNDLSVLKIQLCTYVEISLESEEAMKNNGKILLPAEFLAQCASFGHGALRGIMYLKTINTPLEGVILPPVVYSDVFKKPLEFEIDKK